MKADIDSIADGYRVHLHETRIDMDASRKLLEIISPLLEQTPARICIDLSETEYLDSLGIGSFLSLNKSMKEYGGTLVLEKISFKVETVLKLSHVHDMFEIVD